MCHYYEVDDEEVVYFDVPRSYTLGMRSVEVLPALAWVCDACGVRNYVDVVVPDMSPEVAASLRDEFELPDEDGFFWVRPNVVTCRSCKAEFVTVDYDKRAVWPPEDN